MGHVTRCFLRRCEPWITDELHRMGGRSGTALWYLPLTMIAVDNDSYRSVDDENGNAGRLIEEGYVDCGYNVSLFLFLASMRDDTDNDQLFTNGTDGATKGEAAGRSGLPGFEYFTFPRDVDTPLHKATREEILNCFKRDGHER